MTKPGFWDVDLDFRSRGKGMGWSFMGRIAEKKREEGRIWNCEDMETHIRMSVM
jgi:hypothetical protein